MERKSKDSIRRKKRNEILRVMLVMSVVGTMVFQGQLLWALAMVLGYYVIREAFLSDHIFYPVQADYNYSLSPYWRSPVTVQDGINAGTVPDAVDTLLLTVRFRCQALGYLRDPWVEIHSKGIHYRQYFERGVGGLRYINLTNLVQDAEGNRIRPGLATLSFHHCMAGDGGELLGFCNAVSSHSRVLVIAPHADDAELAAFGVYSSHTSMIVTLTAGEIEAENFQTVEPDLVKASRLKGQLRSNDSVAAGAWGGVPAENIVSLGYFCKQLQAMHSLPDESMPSLTAAVSDSRFFRRYNRIRLASDVHGTASWNSLLGDLRELVALHKPDVIITPHPVLDPHPDHLYATRALVEALGETAAPVIFLLYANHYHNTQMAPFGPAHSAVGLPPGHQPSATALGAYTRVLADDVQQHKAMALQMMHDLRKTPTLAKRLRPFLQKWLAGRPETVYGADAFFRRAVRLHEVFFVADLSALRQLLKEV